jgi:glycosyltransferase involved in cell wall biosynthesis
MFHQFVAETEIEHLIVSRYTEYIPLGIHGHTKKISIIFHDNLSPELVIPIDPKIKTLFGLTDWHAKKIKSVFPQFKTQVINYGVDSIPFKTVKKTENSFIYSSFPNRGLIVLLTMWPKIIKEFPDATLNIYCNLEQEWVNTVSPEMMVAIKKLLKINKTGVTVHGWVSKDVLAEAWNKTEYFLYPCIFEETFCLTALEAAISKTCVISNGLAALSETARHGVTIDGNPLDPSWQIRCLEKLFYIMQSNNLRTTLIEQNCNWAKQLTWQHQAKVFVESLI